MLLQPLVTPSLAAPRDLHRPRTVSRLAEPSADVVARVDAKNAMVATLELYFRPLPPPRAALQSTDASFVPVSTTLLPQLQVNHATENAASALSSLEERTPDFLIKRSLVDLKKLRADATLCVGKGEHCALCGQIAAYMAYCWERPRLLNRAWNGVMSFQLDVLSKFLNMLLHFASQARVNGPEAAECHAKFVAIVSAFLQPDADKDL